MFGSAIGAPSTYALIGLAAARAATTHAPLTGTVAGALAVRRLRADAPAAGRDRARRGVARRLYVDSDYTAELSHRGLRWRLTLDGRRVIESQQHTVDVV